MSDAPNKPLHRTTAAAPLPPVSFKTLGGGESSCRLGGVRRPAMLVSAFAAVLILVRPSAATGASPTAEEQIANLETVWNQAHLQGDVDALDRLWAPDITVIVPEMPPFTKPDLMKMWRSMKVVFTKYSTSGVHTRVYGDTAIVTGRLQRSRDFGGRVANDEWFFTKTYSRLDGEWKVVAYHASVVPTK
jgi:ketosteroid isomerase-like protein